MAGKEGSEGVKRKGVRMEEGAGGGKARHLSGGSGGQEPTGWQSAGCLGTDN